MAKDKRRKDDSDKDIVSLDLHYNFISYPTHWHYPYSLNEFEKYSLPNHNNTKQQEYFKNSGYIKYTIKNNGKLTTDFRQNSSKEIYISGSEIRGRIRSNLEILSFSYPEFVEGKRILYRDIAASNDNRKDAYNKSLGIDGNKKINEVVRAGYLQKIDNKYYIYPAKPVGDKNFYAVEEYKLIQDGVVSKMGCNMSMYKWEDCEFDEITNKKLSLAKLDYKIKEYINTSKLNSEAFKRARENVFITKKDKWDKIKNLKEKANKDVNKLIKDTLHRLKQELRKEFNNLHKDYNFFNRHEKLFDYYLNRMEYKLEIRKTYDNLQRNNKFIPYEEPITFGLDGNKGISIVKKAHGNDKGEILQKGILYCSNNVNNKRRHYVVGEMSFQNPIRIEDGLINSYKDNLKRFRVTNNIIKDFYNIFQDKNNSKNKVVFYLTNDEDKIINIGRTPYMKVSYKNTIKDIIEKKNPQDKTSTNNISYSDAIFGFTGKGDNKRQAYKSRVRFTNAVIKGESLLKKENLFLPQPHASAFGMYLKQDNPQRIISYADNIDEIHLRGYKFYKIRDEEKSFKFNERLKNMITVKKVLISKNSIEGKIYFNNLSDAELGLLLISIDISLLDGNDKEYFELFGGAKAYGYGKCEIAIDNVHLEKQYKDSLPDFEDSPYNIYTDYLKFVKSYKNEMKNFLKENNRTIEEYKLSKKAVVNMANEEHYLDYVNEEKGENRNLIYQSNQILKSLVDTKNNSTLQRMSREDIAMTLSKKFNIR